MLRDSDDVRFVDSFVEDFWSHEVGLGPIDFRIAAADLVRLDRAGIAYEVLIDDVQALIDAERERRETTAGGGWFDDFRTNAQINDYLTNLVAAYPSLASFFTIGQSIENRPINGIAISTGGSGKPAILFNSCQHAREWVSPMVTMYLADQLLEQYGADPELTSLVNNIDFYIIPVINPDGYEYTWGPNRLWRKNRRNNMDGNFGVDLNRNWGFAWGGPGSSGFTASDVYRGTAPFSEPETAALRDFILAHPEIRAHIDYHSFSQVILTPWGYEFEYLAPAPDAVEFDAIGAAMADAMLAVGLPYKPGPIGGILYRAAGGAVDWMYGDRGICSCTVELRDKGEFGFLLPADQILPTCVENLASIREFAGWVDSSTSVRLYYAPPEAPGVVAANEPYPITIQARAWPQAQLNPASVTLWFRVGDEGPFTSTPMNAGPAQLFRDFTAALPPTLCGREIQYYFSASSFGGEVATLPVNAPAESFTVRTAAADVLVFDNFEAASGWTIISPEDTATRGRWERGVPVGNTFSQQGNYAITFVQPDLDVTPAPGTTCHLTGNGPYSQLNPTYVNGITTLASPAYDITGEGEVYVSFWAFFTNSGVAADGLEVSISNNNGASWVTLIDIHSPTYVTTETVYWNRFLFRVADFVAPSSQVRLRFVARNLAPTTNLVEAAVDDVSFFRVYCPPVPGDINGDGLVSLADHAMLEDCLLGPNLAHAPECADANLDADIDVDMADYVNFAFEFSGF